MADFSQLSRLTRKADSVAESASVLVRQTLREIRGELANLSTELNLAGNADDREKVYTEIRRRMALLSRRMNALMQAQVEEAAKGAAKSASALTGLEVKYSPSRAKAICELVTPAQGENLAAVFTDRMGRNLINSLREATVGMLREQAVAGGSTKDMARDLAARWAKAANVEDPKFTDVSGRVWDTRTYIQMNVRTNTMRVYNDCLADNVARETGSDLMRISTGGDQDCDCAAWEGCIISLTGATKGLPTYEDARNGGCFHPNCTHTLEYVDEVVDAAEIELQKSVPADEDMADDYDAQDERKYQIDQARYMRDNPGMTQEQARVAVDRDNLAASIQSGLIREDAREVVAKMTDAQVTALCPNGNPPAFEPAKRIPGGTRAEPNYEPEKWNHGSNGGVVHIDRNAGFEHILEVCKVLAPANKNGAAAASAAPANIPPNPENTPGTEQWYEKQMNGITEATANDILNNIMKTEFGTQGFDIQRGFYRMRHVTDEPTRLKTAKMAVVVMRDLKARFPNADIKLDGLNFRANSRSVNACASMDHQRGQKSVMHIAYRELTQQELSIYRATQARNGGIPWTRKHLDKRAIFDTFRHEFGHIMSTDAIMAAFNRVCRSVGGLRYFRDNVSRYAGTKKCEAVAECFNWLTSHDYVRGTLDSRVEDFVYCTMLKESRAP